MSRDKFFPNPYPDYSTENAKDLIIDKEVEWQTLHWKVLTEKLQLNPNCKLTTALNEKWEETIAKFQYLDYNDNSVYTGTSGVALLKLKRNPEDEENLKEALQLLSLHKLRKKRHTFLCGDTGPLAIGAVIYHRLGMTEECKETTNKYFL